jgi:hypothetical protein
MDIAAFVGFAATGPVDVPVAVSDPAYFTEVYGQAPELLQVAASGARVSGFLADSVGEFFGCGGQRCWVVRVAGRSSDTAPAARGLLPIPGLAWVGTDRVAAQAYLPARSVGSWSDDLMVSAGLLSSAVSVSDVSAGPPVSCQVSGPGRPATGDLLRVTFAEDMQLLFAVGTVDGNSVSGVNPLCLSTAPIGATVSGTVQIGGEDVPVTVADDSGAAAGAASGRVIADIALPAPQAPPDGSLVRLDLTTGPGLLFVTEARADAALAHTTLEGFLYRPAEAPAQLPAVSRAEVLTFQISVWSSTDRADVLSNLGFAPGHPRHAGLLPTDEELYGSLLAAQDPQSQPVSGVWAEVMNPRFPLAGPGPRMLYPIGMDALDQPPLVSPSPDSRPRLVRDGLSAFGPELFLDSALAGAGTETLLADASYVRDAAPDPRPLTGIHSLLDVDEVTLIAVPDALHPGWTPATAPPAPQPPPHETYTQPAECPPGPGSPFEKCLVAAVLPAPANVAATADPLGNIVVQWDPAAGATVRYVLEETVGTLGWSAAQEIYQGADTRTVIFGRPPGTYSYRVRAQDMTPGGAASDWSAGVAVQVTQGEPWVLGTDTGTAVTVQEALLRMCASRGDMFAVLAAPEAYRDADVVGHAAQLRADPLADLRTPTFGALYHPWLTTVSSSLAAIPPDGAAAGVMASTALTRGCWIAPANQPLRDVIALTPVIGRSAYQRVQDGGVNLVRQEPRGFCWLSADTLAGAGTDRELLQITVRRTLSLLARAAREYGADYVFEPLDDTLRRGIQRRLEQICGTLLNLGAFAGTTPDQSYRVTVASPPNTAQTAMDGQLIVEIMAAMSVPLRFLTLRLVVAGTGTVLADGVA